MSSNSTNLKIIFGVLLLGLAISYVDSSVRGLSFQVGLQCSSAEYLRASDDPMHQAIVSFCAHEGYYVGN